jgi:GTP-binding protein HflX
VRVPPQAAKLRARLHELGAVRGEDHDEHGWRIRVDLPLADAQRLFVQAHGEALRSLLPEPEDEDVA